jgi:hypothetical protein
LFLHHLFIESVELEEVFLLLLKLGFYERELFLEVLGLEAGVLEGVLKLGGEVCFLEKELVYLEFEGVAGCLMLVEVFLLV